MMMLKQIYHFLNPKFQNVFLDYPVKPKPRYGFGLPPHDLLYEIINRNREAYKEILLTIPDYYSKIWEIRESRNETDPYKPAWNNGYFPGLDMISLYALLAKFKPARYLEIGSGNSTKLAFKAKQDLNLNMEIISIDPQPRAEIDKLADKIQRLAFEDVDFSQLPELNENDILFVDNSHRCLPNSDATVFFLETLPRLKKGVIVHIHDVYLPYDYPPFMCERFYSEQYGLAMYLLANPDKYSCLLPNYFIYEDPELSKLIEPVWLHPNLSGVEKHGGSFWLRIEQ